METPKIKICGLTSIQDAEMISRYQVDFAGLVLFFPKSKRNVTLEKAAEIMKHLRKSIKKVAVTVSPTREQVMDIQKSGFDTIQIHGQLSDDVMNCISIPIIRAVNIDSGGGIEQIMVCENQEKISYLAFDGRKPGNGETFDWALVKKYVDKPVKIMLAGGLNANNVNDAIQAVHPAIVDVSTGVENFAGNGKDEGKVAKFTACVKNR